MTLFVVSVATVLAVSAICSLTEAALYAVRMPFIRHLAESGNKSGQVLQVMKQNMERPIAAILIVNTAANTAGAAVAGAQAMELWDERALIWFSLAFTLSVLFFAEIVPKVIGVNYSRTIARLVARPLGLAIVVLSPLIWLVQVVTRFMKPRERVFSAPEEEVHQMARLSAEEGSILPFEADLVKNVLRLNDVRARDIMTPRPVVFKLPADMTLRQVADQVKDWTHSRIPVYDADDPETWAGVVLSRNILTHLAADRFDVTLGELSLPMNFVSVQTPGHVLLKTFLKQRTHLFGVIDEYGGLAGIVTLEDVLEALLGEEIVDEADLVVDMQEVARLRRRKQFGQSDAEREHRGETPDGGANSGK